MVAVEGPFNADDPADTVAAAQSAAAAWGVRVPAVPLWARAAAEHARLQAARWRLEYDAQMKLVSFEVWVDGRCVYGSDDLLA